MVDGRVIQLINTHLGLLPNERSAQVEALLSSRWLDHPECNGPVVLCGDFNSTPVSRPYAMLCRRLRDAQHELNGHRPLATWFGWQLDID